LACAALLSTAMIAIGLSCCPNLQLFNPTVPPLLTSRPMVRSFTSAVAAFHPIVARSQALLLLLIRWSLAQLYCCCFPFNVR
jgi:uncharacterized membrane protein